MGCVSFAREFLVWQDLPAYLTEISAISFLLRHLYTPLIDSRARNSNFLLSDVSSRILARSWRLVTDLELKSGRHPRVDAHGFEFHQVADFSFIIQAQVYKSKLQILDNI